MHLLIGMCKTSPVRRFGLFAIILDVTAFRHVRVLKLLVPVALDHSHDGSLLQVNVLNRAI